MKLFVKLAIIAVAMLTATSAFAQKITATLLDRSNGEPIPYATVSVTEEGSEKVYKYVLSTAEGKVLLEGVKKGSYTLKVELMGYKTYTQKIKMDAKGFDAGTLMIVPDAQLLNAAVVSDVGNPIIVKKDTIEYNASSFKTSENDMLIDLLKKLPGIEVENDGTITANGETIKKITIDGKTFFLDDPQLATKNIPSKIIEKVKVVERKSDQAQFTGIDDGEEETIIDLHIKKGMFKGWFGNIMGGGGHDVPSKTNPTNDWRWQGAGFIGNFTDNQQISIILNGNNTNNRGFNDMAGSMMGNMRGGGQRGMGRGMDNAGITTSWMGGVNGAWTLLDGRMDLGGNYLYNGSNKLLEEVTDKDSYMNGNETLRSHTSGTNSTFTNGHRLGIRLDHKFNDNTSILFEPRFEIGNGNFTEKSDFKSTKLTGNNPQETDVNKGNSINAGVNNNWTARGWGMLRQRLGKPGRTMTVNFNYNFSNNKLNGDNISNNLAVADTERVNQSFKQFSKNAQLGAGITYTEPLVEHLFLEANYNYTWREQNSEKNTFDNILQKVDDVYSRTIVNKSQAHRAGLNFMYQKEKFRAQLGVSANPTYTYNETKGKVFLPGKNGWVVNWAPQASLNYDFSDNSNFRLFYWGRSNQPSTSQLMPTPDNSDPLNITLGNPYLMPYFNHSIRGMFRYTNKKSFTSVNASLNGGVVQNPIINTTWYDDSGTRFSIPTNGPDSYNANLRVMVNSPLAKSKFSIFSMTRFSYNNSSNYQKTGNIDMSKYYIGGDKFNFDYEKFHKDFENFDDHSDVFSKNMTQSLTFMQRLRLTFRNDLVELTAGGRTRMNKSWYTISQGNKNATWSNQVDASMNWSIPWDINLIAQYEFNWYNGYTTPQESTNVLNAEITKLVCKKKLTIGIKGYDLLAQARGLSVTDNENFHQETRNNTLGRYIILSLTYRFGNMNNARDKMRGGHGYGGPRMR